MRNEDKKQYSIAESFAMSKAGMMPFVQQLIEFMDSERVGEYWRDRVDSDVTSLWTSIADDDSARIFGSKSEVKPPLSESDLKIFNLDDSDIELIKILKNKLVRLQLYDLAATLRDLEKDIMLKVEYAKLKKDIKRISDRSDSKEFGDFLLRNFTSCHWYDGATPENGQVSTKVYGYTKNDEVASGKTYDTEQAYMFFVIYKQKQAIITNKA